MIFNFTSKTEKSYKIRLSLKSLITNNNQALKGFIKIGNNKIKDFKFNNNSNGFIEIPIPNLFTQTYKIDIMISNPI